MKNRITIEFSNKNGESTDEIYADLHRLGFMEKYFVTPIGNPTYYFRQNFLDEIAERGFQSFLKFTITMDDITSNSMHIDDIERVFHKFVKNLYPAKKLIIIDPYFLSKNGINNSAKLFVKLIEPLITELNELLIITKEAPKDSLSIIKEALLPSSPNNINFNIILSDEFHDRFWINPDSMEGLVIGTSLNGIGKKISIVDKISSMDVKSILSFLPNKT